MNLTAKQTRMQEQILLRLYPGKTLEETIIGEQYTILPSQPIVGLSLSANINKTKKPTLPRVLQALGKDGFFFFRNNEIVETKTFTPLL